MLTDSLLSTLVNLMAIGVFVMIIGMHFLTAAETKALEKVKTSN